MRSLVLLTMGAAMLGLTASRSVQQTVPASARLTHAFDQRCDPRIGIMRGDLAQAHRAARQLTEHCLVRNAPTALRQDVAAVADLAHRVVDAPDLATAARATALLGGACGTCHEAAGTRIPMPVVTVPVQGEGPTSTQMRRHYWASDRMWEGIIAPSDSQWAAGAAVLREPTAYAGIVAQRASSPQEIERIAARLADVGSRAASAHGADRIALYGEYLGACADCHARIEGAGF